MVSVQYHTGIIERYRLKRLIIMPSKNLKKAFKAIVFA
jgi:hypothetical protein